MKATIFARPNLKAFLLGGMLIAVLQHLITNGFSQGAGLNRAMNFRAREPAEALERIVAQVGQVPTSHIYSQLSGYYEGRGEYRKALRYLRLAEVVAETEPETE